jgi:ERCC4-related helicase
MVQTNLSMFFKEDTPTYGGKNTYVHHPYIREKTILTRQYQLDIARHALSRNTAVILPTGLGKTIIAFLLMADILPKRILFLAPTKPLVQQHYESCRKFLTVDEQAIQMLVGNISAKKRTAIFNQATIIIATPQTIQNDLENKRYALNGFGLVIFDEMHHAVERYAYVTIAKHCRCRILGLTASPGSKKKKINKILENLKITHIESRIRDDFDVKDHVKEILLDWVKVPMDINLRNIQKPLYELYLEKLRKLNKLGILTYKNPESLSKKDILGARATIQKRFQRKPFVFATYNNHTVLLHIYHCLELIETQGIESFLKYIDK